MSSLPETDENDDWKEKRREFSRFSKDKPKISKGIKGTAPKRKRLGLPRGRELWDKIKENRLLIAMFFIIILMFSMVIVLLNIDWVNNINIEEGDVNVEGDGVEVVEVEGVIYRSVNETTAITDRLSISKYNTSGIYTKTNITDHRFLKDWDNLLNFSIDISFITDISIDSNQFINESIGLWNFTDSSWNYDVFNYTIIGNFSNSFDFTSKDFLNQSVSSQTNVRIGVFTSNEIDDYSFNLIVNISGYFSVDPTTFPIEFEIAIQYNSIINFTTSGICYFKTNISDFLFNKDYDNSLNFTVDISFITNISIDSDHYINESIGLWNFTSSLYDYELVTITGNYSNSFNYTSNDYLNKTNHSNTTIRFKFQTSNHNEDYSFDLDVNISSYFSVDPTTFPVEFEVAVDPPPVFQDSFIDGRRYTPKYFDGYVVNGLETTRGIETYLTWNGRYEPVSSRTIKYSDNSFYNGTFYNEHTDQWVYGDNKTYIHYEVDAGRFKVDFRNSTNTITTSRFSFKQLPSEIGLYNWDTETYIRKENVSKAEEIILNVQNKSLTYTEIFTNTDVKFTSNETHLKEVFINDGTSFWDYPIGWEENDTYLTIWTKLYDFEGVELYDNDGKINESKVTNGIIKLRDTELGKELLAYLPIGDAWAKFGVETLYTDVKGRIVFRGGDIYYVGAIKYQFVKNVSRTGKLFIDPTWVIGSEGEAWGDCSFNQTMKNQTTNYVQLYPNNSTGNVTSPIGEAQLKWIKIQFDGNLHGESVDIYWNLDLVQTNALIKTNYSLPNPSKYGKWRLVLHGTSSPFNTPEIYNVTVFNDPPNSDDFKYYKEIEIDSSKVNGSGSHIDFPFLISLPSDSDLKYDVQYDGDDIAFSNFTHWLDHEIELFDKSTGELVAWVRIPSLSTSVNTTLRMYYGNSSMGNQENPTGVWDSSYLVVYHLNDDPTGTVYDSTSNNIDLTSVGTMTSDDLVDFKIGKGLDFDGSNDGLRAVSDITFEDFTFEAWCDSDTNSGWQSIISVGDFSDRTLAYQDDHVNWWDMDDLDWDASSDINVLNTHQIIMVYNDTSTNMTCYVDGSETDEYTKNYPSITEGLRGIGLSRDDGFWYDYFDGDIDEVRISNVPRSSDWIETQYNNQNDPDSFFDISSEQNHPVESDFAYYKEIEIDSSKVNGSGSHIDFPFLISLPSDSDLASQVQSDGDDIAFSQDNGTSWLDHEIELFNSSTGELAVWIRIPSLSTSVNTTLRMYYGNTTMENQENSVGVWDNNYQGVWHLSEDPSVSQIEDSSSSSYYGTSYGSMTSNDQVEGQIDGSLEFDGGDDYIDLDSHVELRPTEFTIQAWYSGIYNDTVGTRSPIYASGFSWGENVGIRVSGFWSDLSRKAIVYIGDGSSMDYVSSNDNISDNTWTHLVATYDGTTLKLYIDGVKQNMEKVLDITYNTNDAYIGRATSSSWYKGKIDGVRTLNINRSASWIATEYYNQYDPDSSYSIGSQQTIGIIVYDKYNLTDHKWNRDWDTMLNFTVDITFTTNITIDSNLYINESLAIWNFTDSAWNYEIFNYTIIGNFSNSFDFTSKDFLNQTVSSNTNAIFGVFTSNEINNFTFNLIINASGYFQNATIYYPDELIIGTNYYNNFIGGDACEFYEKSNITDHSFLRDWDTLLNFTVDISFITNISIDSNLYINESIGLWNFTDSSWNYEIFNYTITGNFSNSFDFTSKDFLNQSISSQTNVKIVINTSNANNDYSFDLIVDVSGYFKNATIYNPDDLFIGDNFYNNFTEWDNITFTYYDKEYYKNISYNFKFDSKWVDINYLIVSFNITLNRTIDSIAYQNNGTRIWDVTNQEWDAINITLTGNNSYYFEVYPSREYLTKISNSTTYFNLFLFMSNLDYDFLYSISIQVIAWKWDTI